MRRLLLSGMVLLLMSVIVGCSEKPKEIHTLDCVLHSVVYTTTGKETVFKREDAIKNGYIYHFSVYDDGRLLVNDEGVYIEDVNNPQTYQMLFNDKVLPNMTYTFNKKFNDVYFFIHKNSMKYTYDCNTTIDFNAVTFIR